MAVRHSVVSCLEAEIRFHAHVQEMMAIETLRWFCTCAHCARQRTKLMPARSWDIAYQCVGWGRCAAQGQEIAVSPAPMARCQFPRGSPECPINR